MVLVGALIGAGSTIDAQPARWIVIAALLAVFLVVVVVTGDSPGGPTDQ